VLPPKGDKIIPGLPYEYYVGVVSNSTQIWREKPFATKIGNYFAFMLEYIK
jgi:hypothetical protein